MKYLKISNADFTSDGIIWLDPPPFVQKLYCDNRQCKRYHITMRVLKRRCSMCKSSLSPITVTPLT